MWKFDSFQGIGRARNVQYGSDGCSDRRHCDARLSRLLRLGRLRLGLGLLRLLRWLGLRLLGLLRWLLWLFRRLLRLLGRLLRLLGRLRQLGLWDADLSRNGFSWRRSSGDDGALRRTASTAHRGKETQERRHHAPDQQSQTRR